MATTRLDGDDAISAAKALHGHVRGKLKAANSPYYGIDSVKSFPNKDVDVSPVNQGVVTVPNSQVQAANESPGVLDAMGGASNLAFMAAPMIPTAVMAGAGGIGRLGEELGLKSVAKIGRGAQSGIKNFLDREVGDLLGGNKVSAAIGNGAQKIADVTGNGITRVTNATGISKANAGYNNWRVNRHSAKLEKMLANYAEKHAHNIPSHLQGDVAALLEHGKEAHLDPVKFQETIDNFAKGVAGLEKPHKLEIKAIDAVNKMTKKFEKLADSRVAVAGGSKNMGGVVKELPNAISKSKIIPGAMNTVFIGTSALGMFGAAKGFFQNLSSLKAMSKDITGKEISTLSVLLGNVPKPVAEARSKLVKSFAVSEATGAVSLGMMVLSAVKNKIGMLGFVAPGIVGIGANMLIGESSVADYTDFKKAHASGQKISADDYAQFLSKVSPQFQKSGTEAFAQKIAEQYAEIQASPALVMREVSNGGIERRIRAIVAENEMAKSITAIPAYSHVAALNNKTKEQPVIGNYTQKLVANAGQANHALTPNGV